jgi:hypothetical protein
MHFIICLTIDKHDMPKNNPKRPPQSAMTETRRDLNKFESNDQDNLTIVQLVGHKALEFFNLKIWKCHVKHRKLFRVVLFAVN